MRLLKKLFQRLIVATAMICLIAPEVSRAELKEGDSFPDLSIFRLEGQLSGSLKGKILVVDFWASWCGPCKQSFPSLEALHKKYSDRGVVVIAVSVDEKKAAMEKFLKSNIATFTVVRDAEQKLVEAAGVKAMPTSFVVDAAGRIVLAHSGFHKGDDKKWESTLESLLKEKKQ